MCHALVIYVALYFVFLYLLNTFTSLNTCTFVRCFLLLCPYEAEIYKCLSSACMGSEARLVGTNACNKLTHFKKIKTLIMDTFFYSTQTASIWKYIKLSKELWYLMRVIAQQFMLSTLSKLWAIYMYPVLCWLWRQCHLVSENEINAWTWWSCFFLEHI